MQSELCTKVLIKNMQCRVDKEYNKNNEKIVKIGSLLQDFESDPVVYKYLHSEFFILSDSNLNKYKILQDIRYNYSLTFTNKKSPLCDLNTRPSHYKCDALTN